MRLFIALTMLAVVLAGCDRYANTINANAELREITATIKSNKPESILVRVEKINPDQKSLRRAAHLSVNVAAGIAVLEAYRSADGKFTIFLTGANIRGEISDGACANPRNEGDYHGCPPYSDAALWKEVYNEAVALLRARGAQI